MANLTLLKLGLRALIGLLVMAQGVRWARAAVEGAAVTVGISEEAKRQFAAELTKHMSDGFPTIEYSTRASSSILEIFPRLIQTDNRGRNAYDYLEALANEKPLELDAGFNVSFPALDVRVVNNSSKPLLLTRATLAVDESFIDTTPLLFLGSSPNLFEFSFENEGWGPIEQCRIQFNLDGTKPNRVAEVFAFDRTLGRFDSHLTVQLDEELAQAGVPKEYVTGWRDVVKVQNWYSVDAAMNRTAKLRAMLPAAFKSSGESMEPDGRAWLSGIVTYSWRDAKGQMQQRRNSVFAQILLVPPEYGAPGPLTGKYEAMLRSQGRNYEVTVPISQSVSKGGVTRFDLRVGAPATSVHRLTLKLHSTTGETVDSQEINWQALLPRSAAKSARVSANSSTMSDASTGTDPAPVSEAEADRQLNIAYTALRKTLSEGAKQTLKHEQVEWLKRRDQISGSTARAQFIQQRITELESRTGR